MQDGEEPGRSTKARGGLGGTSDGSLARDLESGNDAAANRVQHELRRAMHVQFPSLVALRHQSIRSSSPQAAH